MTRNQPPLANEPAVGKYMSRPKAVAQAGSPETANNIILVYSSQALAWLV